ncbi:hypothetical protein BKA93DRAFT_486963 [Sparassis latifolia]|uniref:RING-CH-type domain-containing protein n=1 Tax=Sparassis crispa TaxID=139825 RepID=A0A401GY82_9APHY|nr:predicted protein [Sparassis crispa]GBE87176.1 predicted protein [Sparassis crispa]
MSEPRQIPTVDDLRVKLCYICREEERFDNPEEPRRVWTHPCNCTLVAHESCLLHWIQAAQQDPHRAANALKCPQCGATYDMESNNPFILRLLDHISGSLSLAGKVISFAGMTGIVVSFGMGIYFVCTSYGAYAVREFLGKELYDLLLTDDPSNWPWHAFINLPLIPFSLVLSRTRLFDTLPIMTLFLAWPSSPPVQTTQSLIGRWTTRRSEPIAPMSLLTWPPSPIIATILYPLVTGLYRRYFTRVKHWVMGTQPGPRLPVRRVVWAFNEDGPAPLRMRIGANIEPLNDQRPAAGAQQGRRGAQARNEEQNQNGEGVQNEEENQNDADLEADDPAAAAERTMRITNASLGRFVGGALMLPAISNYMGSILFRLSKYSHTLRRILAIRPSPSGRATAAPLGGWVSAQPWDNLNYVKQFGLGARMALNLVCAGTRTWAESDPVWWRNSVGLGIFIVAKDYITLLHLWLAKRELETRRVKSRSFAGVDIRELDLIDSSPS